MKKSESYDTREQLRKNLISRKRQQIQNQNYSYIDSDSYKTVEQMLSNIEHLKLGLSEDQLAEDFLDFNNWAGEVVFDEIDENGQWVKPLKVSKRPKASMR